ncbi:MAG: hypothetical protein MJ233_05110 [Mycoplasmoidaceae bacterium]|nr:hypothetical protein [Mycoplasmoidaceae bacterium]
MPAEDYSQNDFINQVFKRGIRIEPYVEGQTQSFCRLTTSEMDYAETYANLYQYKVSNFYSINLIITI